jgi:peroxiredoxin Q/BCP
MITRSLLRFFWCLVFSNLLPAQDLKVGDRAPTVTGLTEAGEYLALGDVYRGQPYTLVYFYSMATCNNLCAMQACALRDAFHELAGKGVVVIGVSHDDVAAQRAFKEKYRLPFTLIADRDQKVSHAFKVPNLPHAEITGRHAYLIRGGEIVWADYQVSAKLQAVHVLRALQADLGKAGRP